MNLLNEKNVVKSGFWYTLANLVISFVGFISTSVFSRLLTKTEFGLFSNYSSWLTILVIVVTLNLDSTLISAQYDHSDDYDSYILSILTLSLISAIIWFLIFSVFGTFFTELFEMNRFCLNSIMLYILFLPAVNLFQTRARFRFEYKISIVVNLVINIFSALLSVFLVLVMDNKLYGRIIGAILPTVIIGLLLWGFFLYKGKNIKISYWKYALPICLPFIPHLLSLNLLYSIDRVMITKWCGADTNAVYSIAYSCGSIISVLLFSVNGAFAPWLGKQLKNSNFLKIYNFSTKYILFFSLLSIGILAVAPEMLLLLGGRKYSDAKLIIAPIGMGCFCQFLYTLFVNVEQFKKKTLGMAFASVFSAVVNFVLNMIFIPSIGYYAAAYTTFVGYLCLLLTHMVLVKKMHLGNVYNYKLILSIMVLGILYMFFITWAYNHNVIRLIFFLSYCLFVGVMLFKNKDFWYKELTEKI